MAVHERITLGPTAVGVLADKHEVDDLVECLAHLGIFLFKIDTQQERCTLGSGFIVECAVAIIVLEFLQSPSLSADSGIELLEFVFTCQILDVVPASFGMLHLHDDLGNLPRLLIIIFVARGMKGINHQMAHRWRAGRLQPHHRAVGRLQLAPLTAAVGQIAPDECSFIADRVHHEGCGSAHSRLGILDVEITIDEMSECGRTFAGAKDARQNRLELIERIVVIARAVHAPCLTSPIHAIVTVSTCNDVIVVAKSEPDVARIGLGVHAASALSALAITIAAIGIKARTHIEYAVVVEHQACSRLVIAQLDFCLNLVAMVTSDKHQG